MDFDSDTEDIYEVEKILDAKKKVNEVAFVITRCSFLYGTHAGTEFS